MKIERLDVSLSFRATQTEYERVERISAKEDRNISQVIRRIFRRGLQLEKAK